MKQKLIMYTPDYNSMWSGFDNKHWSTMQGSHKIEEIDGKFYNRYGENRSLRFVADKSQAIIMSLEELWRVSQFSIDFFKERINTESMKYHHTNHEFMKKCYDELKDSSDPERLINLHKRDSEMICVVFQTLYNEGFFNRRILFNHSATQGVEGTKK